MLTYQPLQGTLLPLFLFYCVVGGKLVWREQQNLVPACNNKRLGGQHE